MTDEIHQATIDKNREGKNSMKINFYFNGAEKNVSFDDNSRNTN